MRQTLNRRRSFPHRPRRFRAYSGGEILSVTFPSSPLTTKVWIALGADLSASRYTWNWLDITEHVRHDLGISLDVGRREASSRVNASRCQMKLANPAGIFSRRNPMGPYYGLLGGKTANVPIWIELDPGDGYRTMYEGYINDLPTRWTDPSGTDSYVVIQCAGILRRLEQGENLKSPMFRSISGVAANDYVPLAYWPMEDGADAAQLASGIPGGAPLQITGSITLASDSDLPGSDALPVFAAGATASGAVPSYTDTGQWVFQIAAKVNAEPTDYVLIATIDVSGGSIVRWELILEADGASGSLGAVGYDADGLVAMSVATSLDIEFYGRWQTISLAAYPELGNLTATLFYFDGLGDSTGPFGFMSADVAGVVTRITIGGAESFAAGHAALFVDTSFDNDLDVANTAPAMYGHTGELAHVRMARLCREEGIPFVCQAAASAAMGPQSSDTLLEVLRECEKADGGVLFEQGYGLGYQALSERYNQPVALNLDFDQRHIYGTPEPADDDQRFRNQWTIRRDGGSSATYRDPDYSAADGLHDDGDTVSVDTDAQTFFHAGHRVRRDSVDEDRWPRLPINLAGTPDLIPGWLSTPLGSRVNVANPPPEMTPATIDAVIEGYTQRWDTVSWVASMNTSPASIYQVGVAGDATTDGSWAQTSDAELAEDLDTTETSIEVTSTDTWTTTPAGELIVFGGEVVSLDAVSGSAPNWTFTVMRSVNGVIKSHSTASPAHLRAVRVYRPAVAVY